MADAPTPRQIYEERLQAATAGYDRISARWNRVANLRLVAFVAAAIAAAWGLWGRQPLGWPLAALFLTAFIILAIYHARLRRERHRQSELQAIQREAIARIDRQWEALPPPWSPPVPADHPYAADLDIMGRASLFQLVDTTATRMGRETLAAWLHAPAPPDTARGRQGAVADLAPRLDLRQEIELRGRIAAEDESDPQEFLRWAEDAANDSVSSWLRGYAWLGPAAVILLALASIAGVVAWPFWMIPFLLNMAIGGLAGREAYASIASVTASHRSLQAYAGQLELLAAAEFSDPSLLRLQERLGDGATGAPAMLRRLGRLASMAVPPSSMLYLPMQALLMWDIHVLHGLERWRQEGGSRARGWLEALGDAEALSSLAGLRGDNPDWVFPDLVDDGEIYQASQIGHPMLPAAERVCNDVAIGPPGTFLLVTGSNMSGKSTLLRAIGVNAVLAQAGGPVCSAALTLPPLSLWTSARVQDSLERGVSFFMAELQRLKLIVDAAARAQEAGGPRVCYLLDEILQGTNTAERAIAARRVIAYLVDRGAIGAVSTHDLALADDPRLRLAAESVHFTDTVGEGPHAPPMSFDYRLRPGVATTTNALRLMRLIGLELEDPPA